MKTVAGDNVIWDLVVVGGGAAGFFGAIAHREAGGGPTVILEASSEVLGKVKISGGGRCNVTHRPSEPRQFVSHYPRGGKSLIGALHRWGPEDTLHWFRSRGVELKTEPDGRVFPVTDRSQTIIDCLTQEAQNLGIRIQRRTRVKHIQRCDEGCREGGRFALTLDGGESVSARNVLLATGGTRSGSSAHLATQLGHMLEPAVPSLFTFKIKDPRLAGLQGLSVPEVTCAVQGMRKLKARGPLLITHWGLSGPGILRLSAWGARALAAEDYRFSLVINWVPEVDLETAVAEFRQTLGARHLGVRSPFPSLPKRLWVRLVQAADIAQDRFWSRLTREEAARLVRELGEATFQVEGKSLNKDEFVTCGGVRLRDIDMKTMASRCCPGLYFAGEVINVDGLTGGFNFQNAWTTGVHAGRAIAEFGGNGED